MRVLAGIKKRKHLGIRVRLFAVFGVLSALTLLTSLVAWVSYNRLGDELNIVVEENIYALRLMTDLKEKGATITITAPTLLVVTDEKSRLEILRQLALNISAMLELLPKIFAATSYDQGLKNTRLDYQIKPLLYEQIEQLRTTMSQLDSNVSQRLNIQHVKLQDNKSLRWAAAVFLSDIDSLMQREQKKLHAQLNLDLAGFAINWQSIEKSAFSTLSSSLQALYRLKADVNLLVNLVDRAQHLPDLNSLIATRIYADEVVERISIDLAIANHLEGIKKLQNIVLEIVSLTQDEGNIFTLRRKERAIMEVANNFLTQVKQDLVNLNQLIGSQVQGVELAAQQSARNAQATITQSRILMVVMVGASLLFSVLILWLYIGRNMVTRITQLDASMRSIANGNLDQVVPVKGRDEIGAMARSLVSFRDQLANLQEELVQAGKLAALGQLSAGIAHEINQPLSAMSHYAYNGLRLIQAGRLSEAEDNLSQISSLTKRATTIITRVKSLGRSNQEKRVIVDIYQVVNNVLLMLEGDKARTLTTIELQFDELQNHVMAEPIQLEQVLLNLVTNALDAVSESSEKNIFIRCSHTKDSVLIQVIDSGQGIDKETLKQIFDPFFSTKRRGKNLGLGLSISYNIVKSFGGKLSVDPVAENGASFCVQLPKLDSKR